MTMLPLCLVLLSFLLLTEGRCPNSCSGHGTCGIGNTCSCFDGWNGGAADCSFRTCPMGVAWVDKAYAVDSAHQPTECSNAGICDRQTGLCNCFSGFTGSACQRNTCPNDCSGHGTCALIKDISFFSGPDYNAAVQKAGDGKGVVYSNWDKDSIQFCECDDGFFGSDCSMVMCPKGDDPLTTNQDYRKLTMHVRTSSPEGLYGQLGLRFHGKTIFFPLEIFPNNVTCNDRFAFQGKFAHVGCKQYSRSIRELFFELTFYSWPNYPKDNNLYVNDGNPSLSEFFCDTTYAFSQVACNFIDIAATNIREYAYCSNRGTCNFATGACKCLEGYGGPTCGNATLIYPSGSSSTPGMIVSVNSNNFTASALYVHTAKSPAADFNMFEAVANTESLFYIRGDGLVGISKMLTLSGGHTITAGGLAIQSDGCTIFDGGLTASSNSRTEPIVRLTSKYDGVYSTAAYSTLELNTYGTNPNAHYFLIAKNRNKATLRIRADGAVMINGGGLFVTGGTTIFDSGLVVSGGITIHSNGLEISGGGLIATGGLTINANGLRVQSGGMQVLAGGMSILSDGMKVVGGVSVLSRGVSLTGGMTINNGGMRITGGVSINNDGLSVSGGLTVNSGGMLVSTGGLSILQGGVAVMTGGLNIFDGGLIVDQSGLVIDGGGLTVVGTANFGAGLVSSGGITVNTYSANFLAGAVVTGGLEVTGGTTIYDYGLIVTTGGLTVESGLAFTDGGLMVNGGLTVYGNTRLQTAPTTFSDRRLKTNISEITDALEKVTALKGVYFNWIQNGEFNFSQDRQLGVIAQDVRKVVPELVKGQENEGYLSVDYISMIPLLIGAISDVDNKVSTAQQDCSMVRNKTLALNTTIESLQRDINNFREMNSLMSLELSRMRNDIEELKRR